MAQTFRDMAATQQVSKKTIERWYAKAVEIHGPLGQMPGNTRVFDDREVGLILDQAPVTHRRRTTTAAVEIIAPTTAAAIAVELPGQYNLTTLRGAGLAQHIAPGTVHGAIAMAQQLTQVMNADIQQQQQDLQQQQQLMQQLRDTISQLQQTHLGYQLRSEMVAMLQALATQETQSLLGKFAELGGGGL